MAFNYDTLIIDRVIQGTMFDKSTGEVIFTADQIMNPSLEVAGTQVFVTNGIGSRIATFDREKTSKFTAENAQINLGIMAAQMGQLKTLASVAAPIIAPKFDMVTVGYSSGTTINLTFDLTKTPSTAPTYIYRLNADRSIADTFTKDTAAAATKFSISGSTITLPVAPTPAIAATDVFAVWYNYSATTAVKIVNSGDLTAMGGTFDLCVYFIDYCNPNTKYYGHIIFPSIKLDPAFTINFTTDGTHSFSFESMLDNCSADREMFHFIIPE